MSDRLRICYLDRHHTILLSLVLSGLALGTLWVNKVDEQRVAIIFFDSQLQFSTEQNIGAR